MFDFSGCFPKLVLQLLSVDVCLKGVSPLILLFKRWNAWSFDLTSGDWLDPAKTFYLMNHLMAVGVGIGCHFMTISFGGFLSKCTDGMFQKSYKFVQQLPSWVASSFQIIEPNPEAAAQVQAMTLPPLCVLNDEFVCFGSWANSPILHTLSFPSLW